MIELQAEYLNKIANQLILISSLLSGFSEGAKRSSEEKRFFCAGGKQKKGASIEESNFALASVLPRFGFLPR